MGDTTNTKKDKFVGLPVLLCVGLHRAPYVDFLFKGLLPPSRYICCA